MRKLITALTFPVVLPLSFMVCSPFAIVASLITGSGTPSHKVARVWASIVLFAAGIRVKTRIKQDPSGHTPVIFACNHSSLMDIPILYKALPVEFRFIVKKELFKIPLLGLAMKTAGYIPIDRAKGRAALKSMKEAARRIREGASIVIFPEGTRTLDGRLQGFKEGGFMLAVNSGCPVVPVAIRGSFNILKKGSMIASPGEVEVIIGTPIEVVYGDKRRDRKEITRLAHEQVRQMLQEAQGGLNGTQ